MGSIEARLTQLEDRSRERAVNEVRRAWASFTDEEVAAFLMPYALWVQAREPNQGEEIQERVHAAMPEELIARAIGLSKDMESGEVGRRIRSLVGELGVFERGEGIRRRMLAMGDRSSE